MSPWSWFAGEIGAESYGLAEEPTREAVIREGARGLIAGEQFEIIEARASDSAKYEGSDYVPFLRTRNHEIITVGEIPPLDAPTGVKP